MTQDGCSQVSGSNSMLAFYDLFIESAGMSFRLVFDVGLHVDASELQLTERETQIRNMVLWACMLNDK